MINAAFIMLRSPSGRVLLLRRSSEGDHEGEWGLPGGKIEEGETPEIAAVREVQEETGYLTGHPGRFLMRSVKHGVDATTFLFPCDDEFEPTLNSEHTEHMWVLPADALNIEMVHPGVVLALKRLRFNEYEVAEAIRDGDLASPQPFENMMLIDLRVSGTGVSYRPKLKEWVYRRPENYLTPTFLRRVAGMPIIYEHPEKSILDSRSFSQQIVGTMQLPYIKGEDVWGIARIYDRETARELTSDQMSTSPSVVFRDPEVNYEMELDNGETLLVEGSPSYVDHLAICTKGVWDKGGDPDGIRVDTFNDSLDRLSRRMTTYRIARSVDRLAERLDRRLETMKANHP
jgi:mutator protein MutT